MCSSDLESGYPALDVSAMFYLLAPAATPKPVIAALHREFVRALGAQDVKDRLGQAGIDVRTSTPEEAGTLLQDEVALWGKVIKASGVRME